MVYIHSDHLNSPTVATNQTQSIVWRWQHEAFGKGNPANDPDADGHKVNIPLRFAGQYRDGESGLFYNYYRYYNPSTGRYVTSDPIGLAGGVNTYGYVFGNPTNLIDQYGLDASLNPKDPMMADPSDYVLPQSPVSYDINKIISGEQAPPNWHDYWTNLAMNGVVGVLFGGRAGILALQQCRPYKVIVQPGRKLGDRLRGQRGAFGESPTVLKQIHSKETLTTGSNRYSYDYWSKQSTDDIVRSLKPGLEESLKIKPNGRIINGNTRTTILQDRGFDINSLPREVYK